MTKQDKIYNIVAECQKEGITQDEQIAYVLATVEWETNHTFDPVREAYWLSEDWRKRNLRYYPYYGRGYVQLTWKDNYQKFDDLLAMGGELVSTPDMAMEPDTAAYVLCVGMKQGSFTGRKLADYISPGSIDFYNARRIVNGTDKAQEIAQIAEEFLAGKTWELVA